MKIITFWGGLGNQIFEYAYYRWLQEKYPFEKIYAYFPTIGLSNHNGLEVDKHFDVILPPTTLFSNLIGGILFNVARLCRRLHLPLVATCTQNNGNYNAVFHCDYWQDKMYEIPNFDMQFKNIEIGNRNQTFLSELKYENTVAVHVRRGDYLKSEIASIYGGICTEEYYKKAIDEICEVVKEPKFIFFSDDSRYVRETFDLDNMIIVDWNMGNRSIFDMYLMSNCKYMILANSTFSYWAARLNKVAKKIYCPTKWTNCNPPNIILDNWIKIK